MDDHDQLSSNRSVSLKDRVETNGHDRSHYVTHQRGRTQYTFSQLHNRVRNMAAMTKQEAQLSPRDRAMRRVS